MKRIVIKVGSSTITHKSGLLNLKKVEELTKVISDLSNMGMQTILVSSGAVAAGMGRMNMNEKPDSVPEKQALASIGQCELMYIYDKFFSQFGKVVAQMLMTKRVLEVDMLRQNAIRTLNQLLSYNVVPIINENDSVATEELVYGDNDTLGAITAELIQADLLLVLSDIDGLYDKNPNMHADAKLIPVVDEITCDIEAMAEDTSTKVGTGGMITKLQAAKIATEANCDMIICNSKDLRVIYDAVEGKQVGTLFKRRSSYE
ncbi:MULTISPECIES: glutamate 5-kinase [Breznakia]|uniref:Glutamate 5-kinase n=1 Tax=Breznakia blatticola TaxID=1754012 RepID=A0A4V3G651_9FIRM|nr:MULTISPECIES: glutamate 5-kinase [Breznakia]MDH6367796.1 glutamate 5-kinase [Breznakia sp. PH1-1]MDH6404907.1 glutamate 5-kinase [Breznakia sp. PF1-11]MDH6412599.1 glutamate 5-kinase [Breznakia sp. PFB1-11]MDH6414982.1 glutamate 5-kinase [Breznakia sp. PFB1-14]MDH6417293.1 glutamate 5-kinase [Breznakia sp. PFB1-4]